jgi:hypothetical protein
MMDKLLFFSISKLILGQLTIVKLTTRLNLLINLAMFHLIMLV